MYEHKIIKLGFVFSKDDEDLFVIDENKWFQANNFNLKEKDRPILDETDFMTFDDFEIYVNSMEKDGWLFQSIKPFKVRADHSLNTNIKETYYAFFKKSIKK